MLLCSVIALVIRFIFVVLIIFSIFVLRSSCSVKIIIDIILVHIQEGIVIGANGTFKVTSSGFVGVQVGVHVTVVINIIPAWIFVWFFDFAPLFFADFEPLISSVKAIFEHALLTQADGLRELVTVITGSVSIGVVSVPGSLILIPIFDLVLVAVLVKMSSTLPAFYWEIPDLRPLDSM